MVLQAEPEVRRTLAHSGFTVERFFTRTGEDPFAAIDLGAPHGGDRR